MVSVVHAPVLQRRAVRLAWATIAWNVVEAVIAIVAGTSLVFLAGLGMLAARAGGADMLRGAARVTFWSALAMGVTMGVGALFGTAV